MTALSAVWLRIDFDCFWFTLDVINLCSDYDWFNIVVSIFYILHLKSSKSRVLTVYLSIASMRIICDMLMFSLKIKEKIRNIINMYIYNLIEIHALIWSKRWKSKNDENQQLIYAKIYSPSSFFSSSYSLYISSTWKYTNRSNKQKF